MCNNRFNKKLIFLFVFGFLLNSQFINAQKNKYQNLKIDFDEVKAYLYDGGNGALIVKNEILDSTTINNGYRLSKKQLRFFDNFISDPEIKKDTIINDTTFVIIETCNKSFCFQPHHGLVFFKNKKIVGQASICFGCNKMFSDFIKFSECVDKLKILFNEFHLKVNDSVYKCDDDRLIKEIVNFNNRKYGKNYHNIRYNIIDYEMLRKNKNLKKKDK